MLVRSALVICRCGFTGSACNAADIEFAKEMPHVLFICVQQNLWDQ
jgi:hypothetical protein